MAKSGSSPNAPKITMDHDARGSHQLVEGAAHHGREEGDAPSANLQGLVVVSLWAEDVPAAVHFYRHVIGLHLLPRHGEHPHFDLGGIYLTILKGRPVPAQDAVPSRFPLVAFAVQDLDAAVERLQAHGVELPWGVEERIGSRWVMFHDPAGNLIELVQFEQATER